MKQIQDDEEIYILGGTHWKENIPKTLEDTSQQDNREEVPRKTNRKLKLGLAFLLGLLLAGFVAYRFVLEKRFYGFGYPLARQQTEVLSALQHSSVEVESGITCTSDTYMGVDLRFYKIEGLKAQLCDSLPSLDDSNVYLVTLSSDYRIDGQKSIIIGDYIRNGELLAKSNWRAGYFAVLDGCATIGVGRRPTMRKALIEERGSMFRQFALVSAGVKCVSQYALKGKVTRCAYVRTLADELYFVESVNPETLYGFSDALIEFGAVDALYITGGSQEHLFYRDSDGVCHGNFVDDKPHQMVVWKKVL